MAFIRCADISWELVGISGPRSVPWGFSSGGGILCATAPMACHVERWWVLQCRDGKLLVPLTCVNTASIREPPLAEPRWLWSSAPEAGVEGGN